MYILFGLSCKPASAPIDFGIIRAFVFSPIGAECRLATDILYGFHKAGSERSIRKAPKVAEGEHPRLRILD